MLHVRLSLPPVYFSITALTASFLSVGLVDTWIYEVARAGVSWWPKQIGSLKVHFLLCLPYLFTINYKAHYLRCIPLPGVVAGSQVTMGMSLAGAPLEWRQPITAFSYQSKAAPSFYQRSHEPEGWSHFHLLSSLIQYTFGRSSLEAHMRSRGMDHCLLFYKRAYPFHIHCKFWITALNIHCSHILCRTFCCGWLVLPHTMYASCSVLGKNGDLTKRTVFTKPPQLPVTMTFCQWQSVWFLL